jgi:glycosyltransferase involved in cell wall biosynthesis
MNVRAMSRVDLHCHSTASQLSKLGVQRALGLPECATPPEEVYELAKRRGMDFVTITDHDTIAGALQIADRPDVFVSEELTTWFKGEPQAVHVLCYGITPDDHDWLQTHADDVEQVAEYLDDHEVACALAHPFYAVEAPRAHTWHEYLAHVRAGHATARGEQGSAAKWAHAAMALAVRALGRGSGEQTCDPAAVLTMVERFMSEADARRGAVGADLGPNDARALLHAWLEAIDLRLDETELLALLQHEDFGHADLFRRARRAHERKLAVAVDGVIAATTSGGDLGAAAAGLFDACVAAIPYAPAAAFLGREKAKLVQREGEPLRVALVADAVGGMHGVTHTLDEIRARGVPGFEVEVVGTDHNVDRRLSAVAEVDIPFYAGLKVGVPSLPAIVETLAEGRYDLVHLCSPGPAGVAAAVIARVMDVPVLGSYHTELAVYAGLRTADPKLEFLARAAIAAFYEQCNVVLSPSPASDDVLRSMGIDEERIGRWDRGVDVERFSPAKRDAATLAGELTVLYVGRLTKEKGADLLADAFLAARERDPRLHLCLAGGGPEEGALHERLGEHATFLGWLEGDELARAYASADLFLFASRTDTFGQVLLEAQASGLPVIAVAEGGPCAIVDDGVTGLLRPADAGALADAVLELAAAPLQRERLAQRALEAVRERTWARSLARLADGYGRALGERAPAGARRAA